MKKSLILSLWLPVLCLYPVLAQYAPAAGEPGSTAIHKDSVIFEGWATDYSSYQVGDEVDAMWQVPGNALGKAEGTGFDIVSLGRGGSIILTFGAFILDETGYDFAVFENSFNDSFLELAWVEVSVDGNTFIRFPDHSLTGSPVSGSGAVDPEKIYGYAGKYRMGYGTPFDLSEVGLDSVYYVKIIDIPGDGSAKDTAGNAIYDPYPTAGSAGFDLDGAGVIHQSAYSIPDQISNVTQKGLNVYPNPFVNRINIETEPDVIEQISVINSYGVQVKKVTNCTEDIYIDLSDEPSGLYFLNIQTSGAILIKKVVKK